MNRAPTSLTAGICFLSYRLLVRNAGYMSRSLSVSLKEA